MNAAASSRTVILSGVAVFALTYGATLAIEHLLDLTATRWMVRIIVLAGLIVGLSLAGSLVASRGEQWTKRERHVLALACALIVEVFDLIASALSMFATDAGSLAFIRPEGFTSVDWLFLVLFTPIIFFIDYVLARIVFHFVPSQSGIAAP